MTVDAKLTQIDSNVNLLSQRLIDHTSQDEISFNRLSTQVETVDHKLDQLIAREARLEGEFIGLRRSAIAIATVISLVIGVAGIAMAWYV